MTIRFPAGPAAPPAAHPGARHVVDLLGEAITEAGRYDRDDLVERLVAERDRAVNPTCVVLVVGEFGKGKSSLINALLNADVCAADACRATVLPTFVRYGAQPATRVLTADDTATADTATADTATAAPGRTVEVTVPRALLRDGFVLVDTPGVGGGLTAAHAAVTLRALAAADLVLFVTDAGQELSEPEVDFLRQAATLCPEVVCALTKIDFYPQWRQILTLNRDHLRRLGQAAQIVPLSAPLRQHGMRDGDVDLVAESGYPWLVEALRAAGRRGSAASLAAAAAVAHSALTQLAARLSAEHDTLAEPDTGTGRQARWAAAQHRAEQLRTAGSRWQQLLGDRVGDLALQLERDLGQRIRAIRREAGERIAADDPAQIWHELQPWLYRRTNEALLDHLKLTRDRADAIADEVARQFGADAWQLGITVQVDGSAGAARDVELAALAADRSARLHLALFAARGASTGAVVTHTIALIVGLAVPAALPATALVAAIVAGKSWRVAQQSQLRTVRAEAERAVSAYLDEVESEARTDSRSTLRQVHRQLRELFTTRAAELAASTLQTVQAIRDAAQDDDEGRQRRLRECADELGRLRGLAGRAESLTDPARSAG